MKRIIQNWTLCAAFLLAAGCIGAFINVASIAWAASADFDDTVTITGAELQIWDTVADPGFIGVYDVGYTVPGLAILPDGSLQWSGGSSASDVALRRIQPGHIALDSLCTFQLVGGGGDWSAGTPLDGMLYYDTTADLFRGRANGAWITLGGGGGGGSMSTWVLSGDSGTDQTVDDGESVEINGDASGIDAVAGATNKITISLDTTETTALTYSAGGSASFTHTFNVSSGTDPTLTYGDGIISTNGNLGLPTGGNIKVNNANPRRSMKWIAAEFSGDGLGDAKDADGFPTADGLEYDVAEDPTYQYLGRYWFNGLVQSAVQVTGVMPDNWDGGNVYVTFYWSANSTDTHGIRWAVQGIAFSDNETLAAGGWGTGAEVTDNELGSQAKMHISSEATMTFGGTTPAAGDYFLLRIYRDVADAADNCPDNVALHAVKMEYTIGAYSE